MTDDRVLARLEASPLRRAVGVGAMAGLAGTLIYIGFVRPPDSLVWQGFVLLCGGLGLWLAHAMSHATRDRVELTAKGLRLSGGDYIALLEDIEGLERGHFAFRPSNGFVVRLKHESPARWRPGLWWRVGPRLGLGGVTPTYQSKAMADLLSGLLAEAHEAAQGSSAPR